MVAGAFIKEAEKMNSKTRARDLGLPFPGMTGSNNAITDVPGVLVGYRTLISERVRTGVTAILPRGLCPNFAPLGRVIMRSTETAK
jgi:Peptidase family S58